ncbi:uncharacterized protein LOC107851657 isoform X2 [Capsicum annuum]|uniref:uncharacterized protein LOC107851657 isoform X2 n=1 Tax=Capsicum annuum TaxID=4072 RepID=UPI0007BF5FDC|nr:uncharacterized protein LOC107851657 isoform X2 [Capsicum annuum]
MEITKEQLTTREIGGARYTNLKYAFDLGIHSLLTSCSKEVLTSLHEDIQDEFESLCVETQAGPTLNMVEQLVEEQNLDPLFPEKSNVEEVTHYLSEAKQNEISYLTTMLETAEEQKRAITSRLEVLKKERHDFSDAAAVDIVNKIWTVIKKYDTINDIGFHN